MPLALPSDSYWLSSSKRPTLKHTCTPHGKNCKDHLPQYSSEQKTMVLWHGTKAIEGSYIEVFSLMWIDGINLTKNVLSWHLESHPHGYMPWLILFQTPCIKHLGTSKVLAKSSTWHSAKNSVSVVFRGYESVVQLTCWPFYRLTESCCTEGFLLSIRNSNTLQDASLILIHWALIFGSLKSHSRSYSKHCLVTLCAHT